MIDVKIYSLIKVAETGSYSKAAEQLSLTQPAVSQHVHALEKDLNVKIFEKCGKELRVTRAGESVIKCAKRMVSLYNNLERNLQVEKKQIKSLTVGITHTAESNAIAEALAKYVTSNSGVNIKIITNTVENLYDMLKMYELDFAILEGKSRDPSFCNLLMDTDRLVLVVAPNHPLANHNMVTINELKREKMILRLPNSSTRKLFESSLESQNLTIDDFDVVLEIDNIATIKDLIRRGFGVSVLAKSTCQDELNKKKLVCLPIENLSMIREVNIVYLQNFEHMALLNDIVKSYNETGNT